MHFYLFSNIYFLSTQCRCNGGEREAPEGNKQSQSSKSRPRVIEDDSESEEAASTDLPLLAASTLPQVNAAAGEEVGNLLYTKYAVHVSNVFSDSDCERHLQILKAMDPAKWESIFNNAQDDKTSKTKPVRCSLACKTMNPSLLSSLHVCNLTLPLLHRMISFATIRSMIIRLASMRPI